jgi:hypothetical protein
MTMLTEAPTLETFGARLAVLRQKLGGWNVARVSRLCGIDDQSWRNWEAGGGCQDMEKVCRKISEATGCPYVWLMTGTTVPAWTVSPSDFLLPDLHLSPTVAA